MGKELLWSKPFASVLAQRFERCDLLLRRRCYRTKAGLCSQPAKYFEELELLGYTLEGCQKIYDELAGHAEYEQRPPISFSTLARAVSAVDVMKFSAPDGPSYFDFGEYVISNIIADPQCVRSAPDLAGLEHSDGCFVDNLDPYIILRLLAENPSNLDREVAWRFSDLAEGGWIDEDSLYEGLTASDSFLLVTEGSSDTSILKKSLELVEPEVADFFNFIDMGENYPFTGTGNDLEKCQQIRTLGPNGDSVENVNGRAASIEFFLDLSYGSVPPPTVRWTSYDEKQDAYQGELVDKEIYVRAFFDAAGRRPGYDTLCLTYLWDHIVSRCLGKWD